MIVKKNIKIVKMQLYLELELPLECHDDFNEPEKAKALFNETFEQSNLPFAGIGVTVVDAHMVNFKFEEREIDDHSIDEEETE